VGNYRLIWQWQSEKAENDSIINLSVCILFLRAGNIRPYAVGACQHA